MKLKFILPLVVFLAMAAFLLVSLNLNPREVPSPLIGKPAPDFTLPLLHDPQKTVSKKDMLGKVWLFNVWASWCGSCRQEHPILVQVGQQKILPIIGLDYKDTDAAGKQWLAAGGDPYDFSVTDKSGATGIEYGVYGVPETFVIDKKGIIRYKQIGPITPTAWNTKIHPLIKELQAE